MTKINLGNTALIINKKSLKEIFKQVIQNPKKSSIAFFVQTKR